MTHLSDVEIRDLIARYESELSKLSYQSSKVHETIEELKSYIGQKSKKPVAIITAEPMPEPEPEPEPKPRKPRKAAPIIPSPEGVFTGTFSSSAGAKKESKEKKNTDFRGGVTIVSSLEEAYADEDEDFDDDAPGYRLSDWDLFILDELKSARMVLVNSDFFRLATKRIKKLKIEMTKTQLHGKINRSIHKLTHKREEIVKVSFSGKGYAYALKEWLDENDNLLLRYKRKSIR